MEFSINVKVQSVTYSTFEWECEEAERERIDSGERAAAAYFVPGDCMVQHLN